MRCLFVISLALVVSADVYLHNPRGSNNRCDRRTNDRRNANRLFDSQNNAAGGYAAPCNRPEGADSPDDISCYQMNYYEDTVIPIRWTSQHACGENNNCNYVLQYACDNTLGEGVRDGHPQNEHGNTCTDTIPYTEEDTLENPERYGRHESYHYYQRCNSRTRNKDLFTADQNLRGHDAKYTRQNPNGNRYGFECPEERDYYPYWGDTPWIDIAVLTTERFRCDYYTNNSKCFSPRHECFDSYNERLSDIDYDECISREGLWQEYPAWDSCNFECRYAPSSIINRLGIANVTTNHQTYYWRLPKPVSDLNNCVLRLRYNISTSETPWSLNSSYNGEYSPVKYNPYVNVSGVPLRLAINTAQFGRVFEDRSWTFNILKRPEELEDKTIHNLNVQGKRGNIAQVRNCIEYDYVPNRMTATTDDYIHFQWVGSDFNPANNDGEGRQGTDRTNFVQLMDFKDSMPRNVSYDFFTDENIKLLLATLDQPVDDSELCYSYNELFDNRDNDNDLRNCALLNRAEPYFNAYPVKMNNTGMFHIVCTRNNNFSNRGQKMILHIKPGEPELIQEPDINNEIVDSDSSESSRIGKSHTFQIVGISIVVGIMILGAFMMHRHYGSVPLRERFTNFKRHFQRRV